MKYVVIYRGEYPEDRILDGKADLQGGNK